MLLGDAFTLISRAIDSGSAANGYLLVGDLKEQGEELAQKLLLKLFPNERVQIEEGTHPDVYRLEPEGAKRIIKVESMRERIVEPMSTTAFSGGWKVGIIVGADRMEAPSANAFLKTLEEPPEKTLFLLLTDTPDGILPTIVSRCQRVDLPLSEGILEGEYFDAVEDAFSKKDAKRLTELFGDLKDEAEEGEAALVKRKFFKTLMSFARKLMLGGKIESYQAFRNIEAIEEAYHQSEKSMGDEMVISFMLDRIQFS